MKKTLLLFTIILLIWSISSCALGTESEPTVISSDLLSSALNGKYKLDGDIVFGGENNISISPEADVSIDLCGHKLDLNGKSVVVSGKLTVNDTVGDGMVTGGKGFSVALADGSLQTYGGAFYVDKGSLTVNSGILSGNEAYCGGAIYIDGKGSVVINGGEIRNNTAELGGGIGNFGSLTVNDMILSGNSAAYGGGILNTGKITMLDGIITENTAFRFGGGINSANDMSLLGGKISGNMIISESGTANIDFGGAGIDCSGGSIVLGGDIYIYDNLSNGAGDDLFMEFDDNDPNKNNNIPLSVSSKNPLTENAKIGINHLMTSSEQDMIPIVYAAEKYDEFFVPENQGYAFYDNSLKRVSSLLKASLSGPYVLERDLTVSFAKGLNVEIGSTAVIDLMGHTIDLNGKAFSVQGELTINDSVGGGIIKGCSGAVSVTDGGCLTLNGGKLTGNTECTLGGAIYAKKSTVVVNGGEISGNTADGGGAIYADESAVIFNGGIISRNEAYNGGGIAAYNNSIVTINGGQIKNNKSHTGGGIENYESSLLIYDGKISSNNATFGGGICSHFGELLMYGGEVTSNRASEFGAGISLYSEAKLIGGKITGNRITNKIGERGSDFGGAGIEFYASNSFGSELTVGGQLTVYDNLSNGLQDNLFMRFDDANGKNTPVKVSGEVRLTEDSKIGINHLAVISNAEKVTVVKDGLAYLSNFVPDFEDDLLTKEENDLVLSSNRTNTEKEPVKEEIPDVNPPEEPDEPETPIPDEHEKDPVKDDEKQPESTPEISEDPKQSEEIDIKKDEIADIRKLAESGDAKAQYEIGYIYAYGKNVKQDYTEAFEWLKKSAEQGHAEAQYELGKMYANGTGVKADGKEALKWFNAAAANGSRNAEKALREMK